MFSRLLLRTLPLTLLFLISSTSLLLGQVIISGTVVAEDKNPIVGANIVARSGDGSSILAFAISDQAGKYTLSLSSGPDSVTLQVTHLNYEADHRTVRGATSTTNWVLAARAFDLPEMVVRQEAVVRRGDTIVFDVNQLKQSGDENIEAILKHIPGITVARDGKISYDDLQISKFYIEGLDLLEGRYNIATRNLPVSAIRDVEIIEHHQPVLALDSIVRPPNAAINLRLKSSISVTGTASGALGAQPLAHEIEGSLFGFGKQQQFSVLGSANNVGKAFATNFKDLYQPDNFELPLISPTLPLSPTAVQNKNFLDNNLVTGGFNWLRKASKYSQLKWSGYVSNDQILRAGRNERTLLDEESSIVIDQLIRSTQQDQRFNSKLNYEYNHPKFYLKSSVSGSWSRQHYNTLNTINGTETTENFHEDTHELYAKFTSVIRSGKKALRINGYYQSDEQDMDLFVTPLALITVEQPTIEALTAVQRARLRKSKTDVYTTRYLKRKRVTHSARFGFAAERTLLSTDIEDISEAEPISLGSNFINDNRTTVVQPYADYSLERLKKGNKWKVSLPLSPHFFQHSDIASEYEYKRNVIVTNPGLEYVKRLALQRSLSLAYTFGLDYQRDNLFFSNYLLRQSRQASISPPVLNKTRQHKGSIRYKGRNEKGTVAIGSFLEGSVTRADLLQTTVFNRRGEASTLNSSTNTRSRIAWSNRAQFYGIKGIDLSMKFDYNLSIIPINVNQQNLNVDVHRLSFKTNVSYAFDNSSIQISPSVQQYRNRLSAVPVTNLNNLLSYYHKLSGQGGSIKCSLNSFVTVIGERRIHNNILNIKYQRPIFAEKYSLSIALSNLTNEDQFISYHQTAFAEQLSFFQLRNRQVIVAIRRDL